MSRRRRRWPDEIEDSSFVPSRWTPALTAPFARYEADLGGTATEIPDSSGNALAAATLGAATAAPSLLAAGTYLHLEAASAGTNSLSCTAPSGTASYSALPLGGGGATTGAASAGAFTFTTSGDWLSVSLLDAGAVELAKFDASRSGQTGHTDSFGVAWTINRGTGGRKSEILSPSANNPRALYLFDGSNDVINVPAAAIPPLGTSDSASFMWVGRIWGTHTSNGRLAVLGTSADDRWVLYFDGTNVELRAQLNDGTTPAITTPDLAYTYGTRIVLTSRVSARTLLDVSLNAGTPATVVPSALGAVVPTAGFIGSSGAGTLLSCSFEALLTWNRFITDIEVARHATYYGAGL